MPLESWRSIRYCRPQSARLRRCANSLRRRPPIGGEAQEDACASESKRRQFELVKETQRRGLRDTEVAGDDLGRAASGVVARPDFERLIAAVGRRGGGEARAT